MCIIYDMNYSDKEIDLRGSESIINKKKFEGACMPREIKLFKEFFLARRFWCICTTGQNNRKTKHFHWYPLLVRSLNVS